MDMFGIQASNSTPHISKGVLFDSIFCPPTGNPLNLWEVRFCSSMRVADRRLLAIFKSGCSWLMALRWVKEEENGRRCVHVLGEVNVSLLVLVKWVLASDKQNLFYVYCLLLFITAYYCLLFILVGFFGITPGLQPEPTPGA